MAVILALVAALVGPLFVDWTAYRSTFERYAQEALGHRVTVLGKADISLLPAPTVTFTDVRVGEAEDPLLVVSRFEMRVELPPLLKGEIQVTEMRLERPHLRLSLDEAGRLDWLTSRSASDVLSGRDPKTVMFEHIEIDDGIVALVDARDGSVHRLEKANLLISARSLNGPYKIDGTVSHLQKPYSLRVATGERLADGKIRVKADVVPSTTPMELTIDGNLSQEAGAPAFTGRFSVASVTAATEPDIAWRAEGEVELGISRLSFPAFEFRYGPEDRLVTLSGQGHADLIGARRFEIRASAKQIDLDRIYGKGPQEPVSLGQAGGQLLAGLGAIAIPSVPGVISFDVPAVVIGGGIVQSVRLDLETAVAGWRVARAAARLPGRTVIATQGDLALDPGLTYTGTVSLSSDQPGAFLSWWRHEAKAAQAVAPVRLDGRLTLVPDGFAFSEMNFDLAGEKGAGSVTYQKNRSGRSVAELSLEANRLDLDQIEMFSALFGDPSGAFGLDLASLDVSLRILAREMTVRGVEGRQVALEAALSEERLRIENLSAEDFAGAQIAARGAIDDPFAAPSGTLTASLTADSLQGVATLLETAYPDSVLAKRFASAADHLVPATLEARFQASATGDTSTGAITLSGEAGGVALAWEAELAGRVDAWREADIGSTLSVDGEDAAQILRQLGFEVMPAADLGPGSLAVTLTGRAGDGLTLHLSAEAGGGRLGAEGELFLPDGKPLRYRASVDAEAADLAPFALLGGHVLPVLSGDIGAAVRFDIEGEGTQVRMTDLSGRIAEADVSGTLTGDLAISPATGTRRLDGAMAVSSLDMRDLSEVLLGADQWASAGDTRGAWPVAPFGAPLLETIDLTIDLEAGQLVVDEATRLESVTGRVRLRPGLLRFDTLRGRYAGGVLAAQAALTRAGGEAGLSGTIKLTGARLEELAWARSGRPVATGDMDAFVEFQTSGRSISAMVSGLSGGGTVAVRDGAIRGLNPEAFALVIRAADAGLELQDDRIRDVFASHLDVGTLPFQSLDAALSLVAGRLGARNVTLDSRDAALFGSAQINLNDWTLESDLSLRVDPGTDTVAGAEPQVAILFSGPIDAPARRIDITPFTAYLTLRAFEQEVERVEKLQAEILERDRLVRELKRLREVAALRQRDAEEARKPQDAGDAAGDDGSAGAPVPGGVQPEDAPGQQDAVPADAGTHPSAGEEPGAAPVPAEPEAPGDAPRAREPSFEDRIRQLIEEQTGSLEPAQNGSSLPPLEPGVVVDERAPVGTAADGSATAVGPPQDLRSPAPPQQAGGRRPDVRTPPLQNKAPRFVTMPNGVVVTFPAE
ncbi:AsmA family protein [Polymorphum gilvum]|uniref:AsmA family n=1 Tax=Polymorphum gilvum (strain LMG 25793 / CGMCC 1.9160 / SL003B-26A1) TaxID=991905 RepID=F2J299_POLGS|nr:AsmA family protein [Polymorphum gilvum]ADZ69795.1 AsmA family [Polymorphum gilvum SL003B-26A1]